MKLVIVESASKTKTIQKYLGSDYKVVASLGHIMNFPPKDLGINTETWDLTYEPIPTKLKTLKQLREHAKAASEVFLASDPDREGEAIAWHLAQALRLKNPKRILFHEITKKAIQEAIQAPTQINTELVAAQQSRQTLDRLVGWKISPLLWKRFTATHLSAGRVQSVALKAIAERHHQYESHEAEKFWTVQGLFQIKDKQLDTTLYQKEKLIYHQLSDAKKILTFIQKKKPNWSLQVEQKSSQRNPSPPFTTSALQQEAYETFKIPAKETMKIAQTLYEAGYITYMRTDSTTLSKEAKEKIKTYLDSTHPNHHQERNFKSKVANAQEAHEAIRPTHFDDSSDLSKLNPSQKKIYDLIWRRAVASQMIPAEYCDFTITISSPTLKDYTFQGKLSYVSKLGYLKVWKPQQKVECPDAAQWQSLLPDPLSFTAQADITKPEGLYTEASLIKWMEKAGIGRPSTYASIVDKLLERQYVEKGPNPLRSDTLTHLTLTLPSNTLQEKEEVRNRGGTETDRFLPTSLGMQVSEYIQSIFPKMMDYSFTSQLEEQLDEISRKELQKNQLLATFYKELLPALQEADQQRKAYLKANPTPKKEKQPATEKQLKSFAGVDLIKTRYGPALFVKESKSFISVTPFLLWRKIELLDLTQKDVSFLQSLPLSLDETTSIEYGRYGLYLKKNGNNIRLPQEHWDSIYQNSYNKEALQAMADQPPLPKKKFYGKRKSTASAPQQ